MWKMVTLVSNVVVVTITYYMDDTVRICQIYKFIKCYSVHKLLIVLQE